MPNISNAARDIPQLFKPDLQKDEKILWTGRPIPQWFTLADIFMIPFSLMWGGFAFFWEGSVLNMFLHSPKGGPGIIMVLWGIPFCVIGSYMIFGRFFYQRWVQNNIFYAVTNQRVIILSTAKGRSTQILFLDKLPALNKTVDKDGNGSIVFGSIDVFGRMGGSARLAPPINNRNAALVLPAFCNIKDVNKVYELISQQHQKLELPREDR